MQGFTRDLRFGKPRKEGSLCPLLYTPTRFFEHI
jgi:hypothetical protein